MKIENAIREIHAKLLCMGANPDIVVLNKNGYNKLLKEVLPGFIPQDGIV